MGRLAGKIAFITGAGSGIGRAAAFLFPREGASIAIIEINSTYPCKNRHQRFVRTSLIKPKASTNG